MAMLPARARDPHTRQLLSGNWVYYDWVLGDYYYEDGTQFDRANPRPCVGCGKSFVACERPECASDPYHDPCLGHIDGLRSACCGHGVQPNWAITDDDQWVTLDSATLG